MDPRRFVTLILPLVGMVDAATAEVPHVNWENHPVHPLDLSPDGTLLAVTHTADHRVLLFDVTGDDPAPVGSIPVGLDPVSARFRANGQLWVVNHVSDSISIIDVPARRVTRTVQTADEPYDVVFAGSPQRAFVSGSQANVIEVFDPAAPGTPEATIAIEAEDPRALAVSPDGSRVYAAIFESGNGSTILAGATVAGDDPPNVVREPDTPYGGVTPPPNAGDVFEPPISDFNALNPPRTGLIVRRDPQGRWMDDNGGDWTPWVSGAQAADSGRIPGWDLADRDIAIIDTATLGVSYARRLLNMGMAIAVNPATGAVTLVGTDAENQLRFEPNLNGRFLRVEFARTGAVGGNPSVTDLNPHLDYQDTTVDPASRELSLGDPRGIAWTAAGDRGFIAGMGSNNIVVVDADGSRLPGVDPIEVGEGPIGLALDEDRGRLFAWNHFENSLSVVDLVTYQETRRQPVFSPLPEAIRQGRRHHYSTHDTSGTGHIACASCHVDGRMDRLAWDLGDPAGELKPFDQNCLDGAITPCNSFHAMKGPMTTQTLQDIIGHEPFHWRGDRDGLEEFNPTFQKLQGNDRSLTAEEMQEYEDFLATITIPPNPYRNLDNSLPTALELDEVSPGRAGLPPLGTPLPIGSAQRGLDLFRNGRLVPIVGIFPQPPDESCTTCHSLPTGMAPNSPHFGIDGNYIGGEVLPRGPNGENRLSLTANGTLTRDVMKVPQLRNLHEKSGFDTQSTASRAGFGFLHDGSVDSLARFVGLEEFTTGSAQELADLVAFMLAFAGSDLPTANPSFSAPPPLGNDTHAAVGQQVTLRTGALNPRANQLLAIADSGSVDLVAAMGEGRGHRSWAYDAATGQFLADDGETVITAAALAATSSGASPLTLTVVPAGMAERLAIDRDGDGIANAVEIRQNSNPADPASTTFTPVGGHWLNPARDGHGMDLQQAGDVMIATWYTYNEDGTPHWYQATGPLTGTSWTGDLYEVRWVIGVGQPEITVVGTMTMDFSDPEHADMSWTIGDEAGGEPFELVRFAPGFTPGNYTGHWFNPAESGWGVTLASQAGVRVSLVFFYDAEGNPRWVIGSGSNADGSSQDALTVTGFCPWCATVPTESAPAGTLRIDFDGNRAASVDLAIDYPAVPGSLFERSAPLTPISNEVIDPVAQ